MRKRDEIVSQLKAGTNLTTYRGWVAVHTDGTVIPCGNPDHPRFIGVLRHGSGKPRGELVPVVISGVAGPEDLPLEWRSL